MFLNHLYSEPGGLFEPVRFKDGVNYIFGKKDADSTRDSLNGIGKSTTLELIDFCLGSDFNVKSSSRLFKEANKIKDYHIVLEFDVNDKEFVVRRSTSSPRKIEIGSEYESNEYDIKEARKELFEIIFNDPCYEGVQKESWYRSLITFYLKVHKRQKNEFIDPINYITSNSKIFELNQYHLYLMGIDNNLANKNFELQNSVKDRDAALRELKRLIETTYGVDIKEATKRLDRLKNEISKATVTIESFKLAEQHKDIEGKLNELTISIKSLSEENFWDTNRLNGLKESAAFKDVLPESKVKGIQRLYAEINKELSSVIKRTLDEAIEFRKNLSKSRENFLRDEVEKLESSISLRKFEIESQDSERSKLFKSLRARSAFRDLTEAYLYVGQLQKEFTDLQSKVTTYQELSNSKDKWRADDAKISLELKNFIEKAQKEILAFGWVFNYVYDNIYPLNRSSGFSITPSYGPSRHKIDINVSFESEESKGWNKGRTLIYDLAIVLNSIQRQIKRPRFLVHDGIFDGMDKAHFVDLITFVDKAQNEGNRFQYIITLNEEGTLNQSFGATDNLTADGIAKEAISVLTPRKKFWQK